MAWTAHRIVLRLRSPMHIGCGKVGNLQRTRPYVAGRNLWGALTARLTRDGAPEGKPDPKKYPKMGDRVHDELAFTYFFPTTDQQGCEPLFPALDVQGNWGYGENRSGILLLDASAFRYRFLSTYASTALNYAAYSAKEASLHEVECLLPRTRDDEPVYLTGYVFQKKDSGLDWQGAMRRLQIGGERGYGWGRVEVVAIAALEERLVSLFGSDHFAHLDGDTLSISLAKDQTILAHALAAEFDEQHKAIGGAVAGPVEPLVGRETKPETKFGVHLSQARICYAPGSRVRESASAQIGPFGVWEGVP